MVWYGMVWYGMVWYGMVWFGLVWYGMYVCMGLWTRRPLPQWGGGEESGSRRSPDPEGSPPGVGGMLHEMIRTYFELSQSHLNFN